MSRYQRYMERSNKKERNTANVPNIDSSTFEIIENTPSTKIDKECQIEIFSSVENEGKTFICNRYIYSDKEICDCEVQTEISSNSKIIKYDKKTKHQGCNTIEKIYAHQATITENKYFTGFRSIGEDEELIDLAGVTLDNFRFLLKRTVDKHKYMVAKEDRLLIFLMKMKLGVTFSALSVLFGVHRTTVSRIFYLYLEELASATSNLIFWPSKSVVQRTMPDCFHPNYSNTRVIIDCTEFQIEVPSTVDNRVWCYSHYKKGFTAKVLIGITPGGFISFKSKVAGGRKSDSQITVESGLVDLLENGDIVLADKGFPQIKKFLDESGKEIGLVMPPFLKNNMNFSRDETDATYSIARVRIHVERIMQRLRLYQILNKIPQNLFCHIDDILHICCVLVNLQSSIFSNK
ncbi:uncharacterized protein LOC134805000 [Cydia splendana]|uniref:uncharacterized protein LOC134805000 n=1 Tax=Cydia splendana TaxID=1100963 RepID=UPI0028F4827A